MQINGLDVGNGQVYMYGLGVPLQLVGAPDDRSVAPVLGALLVRDAQTVYLRSSAAATADGDSGSLDVSAFSELGVDIDVTAITGTSPTANFYVDRMGADGVWYNVWSGAQITAAAQQSTSIGTGMTVAASIGGTSRLRWVLGGTSPSVTFSASVVAK